MRLDRTAAILLRQMYLMRGSVARVLPLFVWVAVDMILWGFMTRYLSAVAQPGFSLASAILGAVLLWDFFIRVMQGVTTAFLEDVWSRNFLNVFATPLKISEYVAGLVLSSIATTSVGLVVMLFLATGVFGISLLVYGVMLVPFLFVLFLFGIALGVIACSLVLRLGPAAEWFVWPIPALISPFVGVLYPLSTLPEWMRYVSRVLPPSFVFENMRAMLAGRAASVTDLLWCVSLAGVYVVVAGWVFMRIYRHAVRTGLIARYSAETLS